ncbi:MAG: ANTAR domain-containing protein [Hyphomonadaceae bacterium]|nr:ANTAR domain-containing protein [Hyphomonadaceae bacterium]
MDTHTDVSKLKVLVMTSEAEAYSQLVAAHGQTYALQHLPDTSDPLSIGSSAGDYDIALILRAELTANYLEQLRALIAEAPLPVIVFVDDDPYNIAPIAIRYGITSFVVAGFDPRRIPSLIEVSLERFKLHEALRSELVKSQEELAARKIIERAKGLLMEKKQLNEQEAYRRLRELAMRQSKPIKEVAETLILYSDILP